MKRATSLAALLLAAGALAAPALAKTSLSKGKSLCETAAKAQTPPPKSVRVDDNRTSVSDTTLVFTLKIKKADDTQGALTCTIDRATDAATITAQ